MERPYKPCFWGRDGRAPLSKRLKNGGETPSAWPCDLDCPPRVENRGVAVAAPMLSWIFQESLGAWTQISLGEAKARASCISSRWD